MNWMDGMQNALDYIEDHLTEELDTQAIARCAYVSEFHFQRIFGAVCGLPLSEYIRKRRLTLAGEELSLGKVKVIDAALRCGYDSPDSFARAFTRFHGIPPSAAKEKGARLNAFAPLKIRITLEGGTMLEYKIVEKPAFTVMGVSRMFTNAASYQEIPKFWQEHMARADKPVCGAYGICLDSSGTRFEYLIADNYVPWKDVPSDCVTRTIPASTWAVFPCRGALPDALQSVNTRIWKEWLPACRDYQLAGRYNVEMYAPPAANPDENYCEIWVPVVAADAVKWRSEEVKK